MRFRAHKALLAFGLIIGVSGCDELLEVSNPNNIAGDDVLTIAAANGMVNGALAGIMRGYGQMLTSYSTVTDELLWVGSRDAYRAHDFGDHLDTFNEFTDAQFVQFAQGRWMTDEAVRILTIHSLSTDADSVLDDPEMLGWAHLYRAIVYAQIADMFDDFVFSDRATAGSAIGEANMGTLYADAITSLGTAITIGNAEGDADLVTTATAMRASVHHRMAIWNLVGTRPISTGLAASAAAVADANAALARVSGNWKYEWQFKIGVPGSALIANQVNDRQEMRIGPTYTSTDPTKPATWLAVTMTDIIDNATVHPEILRVITDFSAAVNYPALTIMSERELYLIIAEDALAGGNTAGFTTAINNLRALDVGLTPFSGQVPALNLLMQSRQINLFLQGRRLSDHYRFSDPSAEWVAGNVALTAPGSFFPITITECRANENIGTSTTC